MINYRKVIVNELIPYFQKDKRYYLLVCDMGFGAIDNLSKQFPKRVINCGVMEQATVGIASGMSMNGLIPIIYSIVNFLAFRAIEQVRNDVLKQNLNVKFISTGVNDYFKFLGYSHTCGQDDIKIMKLVGMKVYNPYAKGQNFKKMVKTWMASSKSGYIRV